MAVNKPYPGRSLGSLMRLSDDNYRAPRGYQLLRGTVVLDVLLLVNILLNNVSLFDSLLFLLYTGIPRPNQEPTSLLSSCRNHDSEINNMLPGCQRFSGHRDFWGPQEFPGLQGIPEPQRFPHSEVKGPSPPVVFKAPNVPWPQEYLGPMDPPSPQDPKGSLPIGVPRPTEVPRPTRFREP
jgi:hypothetical protein